MLFCVSSGVVLCIVCFVSFSVLFVCICVLYYWHRVVTQLQLNISYRITRKSLTKHSTASEQTNIRNQRCPFHNKIKTKSKSANTVNGFWTLIKLSVAGLSPCKHGLILKPVRVGFMVDNVALGQVLFPVSTISPTLHSQSFIVDIK